MDPADFGKSKTLGKFSSKRSMIKQPMAVRTRTADDSEDMMTGSQNPMGSSRLPTGSSSLAPAAAERYGLRKGGSVDGKRERGTGSGSLKKATFKDRGSVLDRHDSDSKVPRHDKDSPPMAIQRHISAPEPSMARSGSPLRSPRPFPSQLAGAPPE